MIRENSCRRQSCCDVEHPPARQSATAKFFDARPCIGCVSATGPLFQEVIKIGDNRAGRHLRPGISLSALVFFGLPCRFRRLFQRREIRLRLRGMVSFRKLVEEFAQRFDARTSGGLFPKKRFELLAGVAVRCASCKAGEVIAKLGCVCAVLDEIPVGKFLGFSDFLRRFALGLGFRHTFGFSRGQRPLQRVDKTLAVCFEAGRPDCDGVTARE